MFHHVEETEETSLLIETHAPTTGWSSEALLDPQDDDMVVLIGPIGRLAEVDDLVTAIECSPALTITFRLLRAGLYRLDVRCDDIEGLIEWLAERPDVGAIHRYDIGISIVPRQWAGPA